MYSASNVLSQTATRQINAVGHTSALLDAYGNTNSMQYGTDGQLSGITDPVGLSRTVQLDVLSRPVSTTLPNTTAMRTNGGIPGHPAGPAVVMTHAGFDSFGNQNSVVDTATVPTGYAYDGFNNPAAESSTDSGNSSASYNSANDLASYTSSAGVTSTPTRDSTGRITSITAGAGVTAIALTNQYTFVPSRTDLQLASMSDLTGPTNWTYDTAGAMLTQSQTTNGIQRQIAVTRDSLERPVSITYPSGMVVGITYSNDVVASMSVKPPGAGTPTPLLAGVTYQPFSQVATGWAWGNGSTYARPLDLNGNVSSVTLGPRTRSYGYDAVGRIASQSTTNPGGGTSSATSSYDEANQLIGYSPSGGVAQTFTYDTNGNRYGDSVNGVVHSYAANTNRMVTISPTASYTYNPDGTPSSNGIFNYSYDSFGRLASVFNTNMSAGYLYNGLGQRAFKSVTQNTGCTLPRAIRQGPNYNHQAHPNSVPVGCTVSAVVYVYDDAGHLLGEYDSVTGYSQETIWFNGQPVATVQGGSIYYISSDNLGTPRSIVRASDNIELWRWDSDPFGTTAPTWPNASAGTLTYNLRFPGQVYDAESGMHYNGFRYYVPQTGRYLQPDPIGLASGLARYTYVGGNPLSYTDPSGLLVIYVGFGASATAGGGAISAGRGIVFDTSGKIGTYTVYGGGIGGGGDASGGLSFGTLFDSKISGPSASIDDFGGPFVQVNAGAGLGPHASVDGLMDPKNTDDVGFGFTVGPGAGGGGSVQITNTLVTPTTWQGLMQSLLSACHL